MKKYIVLIMVLFITILIGQDFTAANNNDLKANDSYKAEPASISIPKLINYQGKLVDSAGRPVNDGSYIMIFSLYSTPTGINNFWSETQAVTTNGGLFNVFLGITSSIETIPATGSCYLGIRVLPSPNEMTPRQKIVSVPFAFLSDNSDKLQGKEANDFVQMGQTNSVDSTMIINGTITRSKLAANAVDSTKININAVTSYHIKDSTITRRDVIRGFKADSAYFADTAKYTKFGADSARVAANAYKLQGKDTTALDNRYVNVGESNSITTVMIQPSAVDSARIAINAVTSYHIKDSTITRRDVIRGFKADSAYFADTAKYTKFGADSARVAANAYKLQGKDTTALDNRYVNVGESNSITTVMIQPSAVDSARIANNAVTSYHIKNSTITRLDVESNFKAPYSDTSDYVRNVSIPYVDSARVATNTYRLQGKDTIALSKKFVDENQADAISNAMLQNNLVTSDKIQDSTVTRADVIKTFKSPYADTSDYAKATSVVYVDSTRIAVNAHNADKLQGKDTLAFDSRYVNEGQTNSVTSFMITDNTIMRNDVATNFKAPFSDTADYARVIPGAIDSARIAATAYNAYKLQGKDTLALSAKFVDEGQANSITRGMIVDTTISYAKISINAVDSTKIINASIDSSDIAGKSITSFHIKNNTIKREDISSEVIMIDTVGASQIDSGFSEDTIPCSLVASNSNIFLTIGPCPNPLSESTSIKVKEINNGSYFIISTTSHNITNIVIPYKFLIIKQ